MAEIVQMLDKKGGSPQEIVKAFGLGKVNVSEVHRPVNAKVEKAWARRPAGRIFILIEYIFNLTFAIDFML